MRIEQRDDDVLIWVKAVPGAARDAVAGVVGERLKIRISAPPEGGRANQAICCVLARAVGRKPRDVSIESGATSAEKIVRIANMTVDLVRAAIS